jgi:hypothetical protein
MVGADLLVLEYSLVLFENRLGAKQLDGLLLPELEDLGWGSMGTEEATGQDVGVDNDPHRLGLGADRLDCHIGQGLSLLLGQIGLLR